MSELIALLSKGERLRLATTLEHANPYAGRDLADRLHVGIQQEVVRALPDDGSKGGEYPKEYQRYALTADTLKAIDREFARGSAFRNVPVALDHVQQARDFVREHYGFDASQVPVLISAVPQTESVEGFFMSCDIAEGTAFLLSILCSPVELIVHEFGHAMHTTLRRQNHPTDYRYWMNPHHIGPEMCAYHAQFSYLLKHGTKEQFFVALAAILAYTSYLLCLHALGQGLTLEEFTFQPPVAEYNGTGAWDAVIRMYAGMLPTAPKSKENVAHAVSEYTRGMGLALAFKLIDDPQGLIAFMKDDSAAVPILVQLSQAFPHRQDLNTLDDINEVIARLGARFTS